ncbi:hypothetical protein [Mesonia aestuariivivens]|uniref:TonB-dependent receptor n=1 Tax=Mesonia aestuariivivens TaxID=2796128 RepID=A0ABS6W0Q1_9FLAO|nr:hypothetical protein [Mesonia aestuariivivens]MBW2961402.1 hypothetical protein [Mesonia aestuariivivens]
MASFSSALAQDQKEQKLEVKDVEKVNLPIYLENINYDQDENYTRDYTSQLKFKKGSRAYVSSQRANYLFKEMPLLKSIQPNYNYLGGNLNFENNCIPNPEEVQPR